jgi:hypothetical protein
MALNLACSFPPHLIPIPPCTPTLHVLVRGVDTITGRWVEPERMTTRSQVSGHGERNLTGVPSPLPALIADVGTTFPGGTTMQAGVSYFCRCDDFPNDLGVRTGAVPKEVVTAGAHAAQESAKEFGQQEFGEVFPDGCQAV